VLVQCLQLFIDPAKLLPLARFLPRPPGEKPRGGQRGGRGAGGRGKMSSALHLTVCVNLLTLLDDVIAVKICLSVCLSVHQTRAP